MKSSLKPGLTSSTTFEVTEDMSPPHLPMKVLSTPSMVQLIEQVCLLAAQEHLDDGETTVGIHVCVSHAAAAAAGESVSVSCELTEMAKDRFLTFTTVVSADDGARVLSEGTHQRAIIKTN